MCSCPPCTALYALTCLYDLRPPPPILAQSQHEDSRVLVSSTRFAHCTSTTGPPAAALGRSRMAAAPRAARS